MSPQRGKPRHCQLQTDAKLCKNAGVDLVRRAADRVPGYVPAADFAADDLRTHLNASREFLDGQAADEDRCCRARCRQTERRQHILRDLGGKVVSEQVDLFGSQRHGGVSV
jgi:hypothetical protein